MRFDRMATDTELMQEVGRRLRLLRIQARMTQDELAKRQSLNPKTVARAEAGEDPRLSTIISLLRGLNRLHALEAFLPEPIVSPLDLTQAGQGRQRVRKT